MVKLTHGGDLTAAEETFGIAKEDWLDLSTGINPKSWTVPALPAEIWRRLPTLDKELVRTAKAYYACHSLLPIPGSQFAIQTLPKLFSKCSVGIPLVGYQEHKSAWERAGHKIIFYSDENLEELDDKIGTGQIDHVIVINPNNPSCQLISEKRLMSWLKKLQTNNGYLIIDETFIDTMPQHSMSGHLHAGNLIILRSLGKFFGLAGIRLGFLLAQESLCNRLQERLGPWAVSGPAQWLGIQALADTDWHGENRQWLEKTAAKLRDYLQSEFSDELISIKHTPLYVTLKLEKNFATDLYKHLGQHGILIRLIPFNEQHSHIRFGLVANEEQWHKLKTVMDLRKNICTT